MYVYVYVCMYVCMHICLQPVIATLLQCLYRGYGQGHTVIKNLFSQDQMKQSWTTKPNSLAPSIPTARLCQFKLFLRSRSRATWFMCEDFSEASVTVTVTVTVTYLRLSWQTPQAVSVATNTNSTGCALSTYVMAFGSRLIYSVRVCVCVCACVYVCSCVCLRWLTMIWPLWVDQCRGLPFIRDRLKVYSSVNLSRDYSRTDREPD